MAFNELNKITQPAETENEPDGANGTNLPKYRFIFENLKEAILSGGYAHGARLPSETNLVRRFGVSRMTIVKAIKELEQSGLVVRRVGSGTYASARSVKASRLFGLLIPELGQTEIFEPICRGMANYPQACSHSLLWGNSAGVNQKKEQVAMELCQQYIAERVAGVFFAPLELLPAMNEVNQRIAAEFDRAGIPVVLLDRCFLPYPSRSKHDLVGIDNRRTAYSSVEYLFDVGARRIAFLGMPYSAPTVDARIAGYREAILAKGYPRDEDLVFRCAPDDEQQIRNILDRHRPDAFLCANDRTAASLMQTLISLGVSIPEEVRIVGIDDVKYASLLPIPLTTQHQPCLDIGRIAMSTMLDRMENPDLSTRDILLSCRMVIRKSCGGKAAS